MNITRKKQDKNPRKKLSRLGVFLVIHHRCKTINLLKEYRPEFESKYKTIQNESNRRKAFRIFEKKCESIRNKKSIGFKVSK